LLKQSDNNDLINVVANQFEVAMVFADPNTTDTRGKSVSVAFELEGGEIIYVPE
jgi:hypothetical protein